MGLRAGLLRESIDILQPTIERNDFGEETTTWTVAASTRARVDFRSGTRLVDVNEVAAPYTVTFIIRRFYALTEYYRLRWRGRLYSIASINFEEAKQMQTIIAQVINE